MEKIMNKLSIGKFSLSLIILIFLLAIITTNAYSTLLRSYTSYTCSFEGDCIGLYAGLYGSLYETCRNWWETGWYLTYTEGICPVNRPDQEKIFSLPDLFSNPLSYIYKFSYPYSSGWFYFNGPYSLLLKSNVFGIGEKTETMETCEMCTPDILIRGVTEAMMGMSHTWAMCLHIPPDIFIWPEPAAPPAY